MAGATVDQEFTICPIVGNPFMVPEILEHLFTYFTIPKDKRTLLRLRFVCKAWNQEICRKLRQQHQIILNSLASLQHLNEFSERSTCRGSELIPFHNYYFCGRWPIYTSNLFNSSFDSKCIQTLHLAITSWNLRDLEWFFHEVDLPNLRHLTLQCPNDVDLLTSFAFIAPDRSIRLTSLVSLEVDQLKTLMIPWICDLIERNTHLKLLIFHGNTPNYVARVFPSALFRTISCPTVFTSLHELKLDYYISNPQLNTLISVLEDFKPLISIKSLSFGLQSIFNSRILYKLLITLQNSLERLELNFEWISDKFNLNSIQFPIFSQLVQLKLSNLKCSFDWFVKHCPNLQYLRLHNFEAILFTAIPFNQATQVQCLCIRYSSKCNHNCVEDLCYIFPRLKSLRLKGKLYNCEIQMIIAKLDKLVELKLEPQRGYFDNECFKGKSVEGIGHNNDSESTIVALEGINDNYYSDDCLEDEEMHL